MTVKMALLGFLGLVLLIPLQLIKEVIRERSANADAARTRDRQSVGCTTDNHRTGAERSRNKGDLRRRQLCHHHAAYPS
ncbi:MAG: inner membrane CreD family protein [Marinilabiliales bacterium]|nr:inner membrane CreD family protein [Marinilabiliales bacterium]